MALQMRSVTQLSASMIKSITLHSHLIGQIWPHLVHPQQPQRGAHQHTVKHQSAGHRIDSKNDTTSLMTGPRASATGLKGLIITS